MPAPTSARASSRPSSSLSPSSASPYRAPAHPVSGGKERPTQSSPDPSQPSRSPTFPHPRPAKRAVHGPQIRPHCRARGTPTREIGLNFHEIHQAERHSRRPGLSVVAGKRHKSSAPWLATRSTKPKSGHSKSAHRQCEDVSFRLEVCPERVANRLLVAVAETP